MKGFIIELLKVTLLIEIMAMLVCLTGHLAMFLINKPFPLGVYPIMAGMVLICCVFAMFFVKLFDLLF